MNTCYNNYEVDSMFKIGKLENVKNEVVTINTIVQTECSYENGKKIKEDSFNSFSFNLNCKLEKLLDIQMNKTINFNDYIFGGETWLNVKGLNGAEPQIDVKITRYLKNKFIIYLTFYTDYSYDEEDYSGIIEFTFNLDDYLGGENK